MLRLCALGSLGSLILLQEAQLLHAEQDVVQETSPHEKELSAPDKPTPSELNAELRKKQGMNANQDVDSDILDRFTDLSSWFWTYSLAPNPKSVEWAQKNNKEFVPLVNLKSILPPTYKQCSFEEGTCTVDQLVEVLEDTKKKVTTKYLMAYNEPYDMDKSGDKKKKGITPYHAAEIWRKYVQPAAKRTGLKLVSPTTGVSKQKAAWMISFLQACYAHKDSNHPCDVSLIEVFSVHEYKCYGSFWRKYTAVDGGDDVKVKTNCKQPFKPHAEVNIYTNMKQAMRKEYGAHLADTFWDPYFNNVKLWVTETSCHGDQAWDKLGKGKNLTREVGCEAITGQSCNHMEGSVEAILGLDNIERFSWFTLLPHPSPDRKNYDVLVAGGIIDFKTRKPTGVGRALLNALDPNKAQCSAKEVILV